MLTRVAVNLTPRAAAALTRLTADGTSKTDAICRALSVAAATEDLAHNRVLTVQKADGTHVQLIIM